MRIYWTFANKEDEPLFRKNKDKLKGRIPLYLQVVNGLIGGFEVTDWFNDNICIGYLYLQNNSDGSIIQNMYIYDNKDAGNIAIELLDSLNELSLEEQSKQLDVRYCLDMDGNEPTKAILVIKIGEYGMLQEDLYSVYFTGKSIRQYGYMKDDYNSEEKRSSDESDDKYIHKVHKSSFWKSWFRNFAKRIGGK